MKKKTKTTTECGGHRKKVEKVLLETRRVRLRPERDRVRETVARRVVLLREQKITRMGSIGNGVRSCSRSLTAIGRSVCRRFNQCRIWRGARYGDRSIGDDWTGDHPVEHYRGRAIRVHLVNILRPMRVLPNAPNWPSVKRTCKDMRESRFRLLRLYYTNRIFMGVCCVSTEVLYLCLFMARDEDGACVACSELVAS